ncbi:HPP [Gilliamella apicola]|nr:HPP [Gilliamella apicola]
MAPFGASCVILFAVSQSPLAQPRNVIFGHLIAAFVGLVFLKLFGTNIIVVALAVGVAIVSMQYFRALHPPAGANPLVILLTADKIDYGFSFLLFPVLSGSVILVMIAYLVNNLFNKTHWPIYWLALFDSKKEP